MTLDPQVANSIRQGLAKGVSPLKILIFGSYATGNATPESDVDILAIVGDENSSGREATLQGRLAIRRELVEAGQDMSFDLFLTKQSNFEESKNVNGTIQHIADKQGMVIYG